MSEKEKQELTDDELLMVAAGEGDSNRDPYKCGTRRSQYDCEEAGEGCVWVMNFCKAKRGGQKPSSGF